MGTAVALGLRVEISRATVLVQAGCAPAGSNPARRHWWQIHTGCIPVVQMHNIPQRWLRACLRGDFHYISHPDPQNTSISNHEIICMISTIICRVPCSGKNFSVVWLTVPWQGPSVPCHHSTSMVQHLWAQTPCSIRWCSTCGHRPGKVAGPAPPNAGDGMTQLERGGNLDGQVPHSNWCRAIGTGPGEPARGHEKGGPGKAGPPYVSQLDRPGITPTASCLNPSP